jgi:hypothetical protein
MKFTLDEDAHLRNLVNRLGSKNWDNIALHMPNRTARQCRDRYKNYLVDPSSPDPWLPEEDEMIVQAIKRNGPKWVEIAKLLRGRTAIHVKNRWHRHLCKQDPEISRWRRQQPIPPPKSGPQFPAQFCAVPPKSEPPPAPEGEVAEPDAPKKDAPEPGGLDWDQILPRARPESVRRADCFSDWYF